MSQAEEYDWGEPEHPARTYLRYRILALLRTDGPGDWRWGTAMLMARVYAKELEPETVAALEERVTAEALHVERYDRFTWEEA